MDKPSQQIMENQMSKQRYSAADLDARLKFILGLILGLILLFTAVGILYALIFVTQPVNAQSENDKMFFNVLGSIATFITGTLAGILIGSKGGDTAPIDFGGEETPAPVSTEPTAPTDEPVATGKPEGQMPDEQEIDEDWDKN
jgi:hypothetical protein